MTRKVQQEPSVTIAHHFSAFAASEHRRADRERGMSGGAPQREPSKIIAANAAG